MTSRADDCSAGLREAKTLRNAEGCGKCLFAPKRVLHLGAERIIQMLNSPGTQSQNMKIVSPRPQLVAGERSPPEDSLEGKLRVSTVLSPWAVPGGGNGSDTLDIYKRARLKGGNALMG